MTTNMTTAELLAHAEALRTIQHDLNRHNTLALSDNAWGHLDKAIREVLTEAMRPIYKNPAAVANRALDEAYDNGENIDYQLQLFARGEITL